MTLIDDNFTRNGVRALLKLWQESGKLGEHALAQTGLVAQLRAANNYADSTTGRGVALRDLLRASMESLRPEGEADYGDKRWRPFLILTEQYVNGRKPEYLAELFGLVRGSFHQEQARALELLGDKLRERLTSTDRAADEASVDASSAAPRIPFLAPTRPATPLIGRESLLSDIRAIIFGRDEALVAVHGLPGAGKTALAVELANDRDVLDVYNEGVLWAGLGPQPDIQGALGSWATALGLSRDDIARLSSVEARAAAIHSVIGFRRMLLIIDDVWQIEHGDLFQLGGPNCAHVFTTRQPALALALAGRNTLSVPELDTITGTALVASHAPEIVAAHGDEIAALVEAVGGLPLALSLMGRRLRNASIGNQTRRAAQTLTALNAEFGGHDGKALSGVIASSEALLEPDAQRALYALAPFPPKPASFSEDAAVAAADCDIEVLDTLVDAGLVESIGARLTLHQTIHDHARSVLLQANGGAVLQRIAAHYVELLTTQAPDNTPIDPELGNMFSVAEQLLTHGLQQSGAKLAVALAPQLTQRGQLDPASDILNRAVDATALEPTTRAQLDIALGRIAQRRGDFAAAQTHFEHAETCDAAPYARVDLLLAQATLANDRGEREHADVLGKQALALARTLDDPRALSAILTQLAAAAGFRAQFEESEAYLIEARGYAQRSGDARAEALLSLGLGLIDSWLGNVAAGDADFERSYALAKKAGARETASIVRSMQGWVNANLGNYEQAIAQSQESLALIREGSFCESAGLAYTNLGFIAMNRGALDEAEGFVDRGSAIVQQIGHKEGECMMFNSRARMAAERNDYIEAERLAREGIQRCDALAYWELMPALMTTLGEVLNAQGRYDDADGFLFTALLLAQNMQRPWLLAYGHSVWGGCYLEREELDKATESFDETLRIAEALGAKPYSAVALFGLARIAASRGDVTTARGYGERSLAIFEAIGHARAKRVRAWLAGSEV